MTEQKRQRRAKLFQKGTLWSRKFSSFIWSSRRITTTTAMSFNGCARPSPPTVWPPCTASPPIVRGARPSARTCKSTSSSMTRPTSASGRKKSASRSRGPGPGWSVWSACNPISFRAPSIWRGGFARKTRRSPLAAFMFPAACPCCPSFPPTCARPRRSGSACSPERRKAGSTPTSATQWPAS